jgi:GTP-binding protein YchF
MKFGLIGLPGAGKTTIFEALTQNFVDPGNKRENRLGTIKVPDKRLDVLSGMYQPKKTTYAQIEYFLPGVMDTSKEKMKDQTTWIPLRECDALIHVLRNFEIYGSEKPSPQKDFQKIDMELILADLIVVEKRLERIKLDQKRGKKMDQEEFSILKECLTTLENEIPLRENKTLASSHLLKGYAFISAKPMLVLFNNEDEDSGLPDLDSLTAAENCSIIRGKLEHELSQMSSEEAEDFLKEFNITASAKDRVIYQSYKILGLISFFTVGKDEVKAWTIKNGTTAADAAGVIHSDMKKGFICAEVLPYEELINAGTYQEARKKGTVRLEGKTYEVLDGDIINFRFNV